VVRSSSLREVAAQILVRIIWYFGDFLALETLVSPYSFLCLGKNEVVRK
jgi:hypothetical protein